ncbi:MAG TPA: hypothetical protein DF613_11880 [Lachnospiraceae bacterium]|nr:hypothetical protein [Lachnospiraceae bacterium]
MALSYGRKSNSTNWVFRYEDYLLPYLLEYAPGDMTLRTLCHPGLLKLIGYDRKNYLEYTKTLKTFVENNCSQSSTCRSMYIQRSTLLQRLSRINDLTGFDLEDADTRLYLLIFFSLSGAAELI